MQNIIGNIIGNSSAGHMSGGGFTNEYSLLFDGVDEYVDVGRVTEMESATAFSISLWVQMSTNSTQRAIMGKLASANDSLYLLKMATTNKIRFQVGGTDTGTPVFGHVTSTNAMTFGAWFNIIAVFDGSLTGISNIAKIYFNGSLETTTTGGTGDPDTLNASTSAFQIGKITSSAAARWVGNQDEVAFFDYALSAAQITSINDGGVAGDLNNTTGLTAPVHYYRNGDDDTYPTINDVGSAGGNNGTMTNMEAGDIVADAP